MSTVSLTEAELVDTLDSWVLAAGPLQVAGMTYAWSATAGPGARVVAANVTVGGAPLVPTDISRVTVNSIVGDPSITPAMAGATNIVGAGVDIDLLTAYFARASPITPSTEARITRLP